MKKINKLRFFKEIIALIVVLLIIIVGYYLNERKVQNIQKDGQFTFGYIEGVDNGGNEFDLSIKYSYSVQGDLYDRTIEVDPSDKWHFKGCLWQGRDCSGGYVWVLYSKSNPESSLVNLDQIYGDTLNTIAPVNFNGFY